MSRARNSPLRLPAPVQIPRHCSPGAGGTADMPCSCTADVSCSCTARCRHEGFLRGVPIFRQLAPEQLAAVADCLACESFDPGAVIIAQGQALGPGAKFYIVESGRVDCFRSQGAGVRGIPMPPAPHHAAAARALALMATTDPRSGTHTCLVQVERKLTRSLQPGDVFGEVALLTNAPRQADCVAATAVKARGGVARSSSCNCAMHLRCCFLLAIDGVALRCCAVPDDASRRV